jgi:hypothetical protein
MQTANVFLSEVLWRLPISVRIGMLEDLLERRGLTDLWPFIVPVLRSFFELRNTLAHGLTFTGLTPDGPAPHAVTITTLKRGRGVTVSKSDGTPGMAGLAAEGRRRGAVPALGNDRPHHEGLARALRRGWVRPLLTHRAPAGIDQPARASGRPGRAVRSLAEGGVGMELVGAVSASRPGRNTQVKPPSASSTTGP